MHGIYCRADGSKVIVIKNTFITFGEKSYELNVGDALPMHSCYEIIEGPIPKNKVNKYYTVVLHGNLPVVVSGDYLRQLEYIYSERWDDDEKETLTGMYCSDKDIFLASITTVEEDIDGAVIAEGGSRADYSWSHECDQVIVTKEDYFRWSKNKNKYIPFMFNVQKNVTVEKMI